MTGEAHQNIDKVGGRAIIGKERKAFLRAWGGAHRLPDGGGLPSRSRKYRPALCFKCLHLGLEISN